MANKKPLRFRGFEVVAPTGVDPVTSRFSVVRITILISVLDSQTLDLIGFMFTCTHVDLLRFKICVGKMWANIFDTCR